MRGAGLSLPCGIRVGVKLEPKGIPKSPDFLTCTVTGDVISGFCFLCRAVRVCGQKIPFSSVRGTCRHAHRASQLSKLDGMLDEIIEAVRQCALQLCKSLRHGEVIVRFG